MSAEDDRAVARAAGSARRRAVFRLLGCVATALAPLFACAPPAWIGSSPERAGHAEPSTAALAPKPAPRPRANEIAVRLEAHDGAHAIEVERDGVALAIARHGARLVASNGERGPWIEVAPGTGRIGLGDRSYAGSLVVSIRPAGGLTVVHHVDVEDYVRGVVASELAIWSAPPALLEAQAIAARSYALAQIHGRPGASPRSSLSDGTRDQVYRGEYVPGASAGARAVELRLRESVERTRGIVLTLRGRILDTRFHACCGGATAAFEGVFAEADPGGMQPVLCAPCRRLSSAGAREASTGGASAVWEHSVGGDELARLARELGLGSRIDRLLVVRHDEHGRWMEVRLVGDRAGANVSGTELRRLLGWEKLKSAWITGVVPTPGKPIGERLVFSGRGRGHGVGLCQTGARALADEGRSSAEILGHFFPSATFAQLAAAKDTGLR